MKKIIIVLATVLAIAAVSSCKNKKAAQVAAEETVAVECACCDSTKCACDSAACACCDSTKCEGCCKAE